jgi:3-hydroxyisobutyrate dehydrogenase-like beta-hydroxyacid dehydrogenase
VVEDNLKALLAQGAWMLDAPVTGGVWGAEHAELSMIIGGNHEAFLQ